MSDPSASSTFALPISKIMSPGVAAAPTGGLGLALDFNGKVPSSALSVPRVFTQTIAGGPPSSPINGDIWIATDVDLNGVRWAFQYNSAGGSFKWEFIGGADTSARVGTSESTASGYPTYADLTTVGPSVVVARAGDYEFEVQANAANNTAAAQCVLNARSTTVAENDLYLAYAASAIANAQLQLQTMGKIQAVAAGDTIKARYCTIGGTSTFGRRAILVRPIRVA